MYLVERFLETGRYFMYLGNCLQVFILIKKFQPPRFGLNLCVLLI